MVNEKRWGDTFSISKDKELIEKINPTEYVSMAEANSMEVNGEKRGQAKPRQALKELNQNVLNGNEGGRGKVSIQMGLNGREKLEGPQK